MKTETVTVMAASGSGFHGSDIWSDQRSLGLAEKDQAMAEMAEMGTTDVAHYIYTILKDVP